MVDQAEPGQRVFLSYTQNDQHITERVAEAIRRAGFTVLHERLDASGRSDVFEQLSSSVRASDVVVILLTPDSAVNHWLGRETLAGLTTELGRRDVDVIAAGAAGTAGAAWESLPVVDLLDEATGLRRLVERIRGSTTDFSSLSYQAFESLVADLLQASGFSISRPDGSSDRGVDFWATLTTVDQFGAEDTELWLVETKLYTHRRVSIDTIRQLAGAVAASPPGAKAMLVTSAHLTSAARDYLESVERTLRTSMRVLDGTTLRQLLGRFPDITAKYFPTNDGQTQAHGNA